MVRTILAAAIIVGVVVGTPAAASAASPAAELAPSVAAGSVVKTAGEWPFPDDWTQPARPEDLAAGKVAKPKAGGTWKYDASKTKWRGFMINIGSSVLGAAAPKSWQAEQIANRYSQKGMPSGEQLNSQYGYTSVRTDPTTGKTYSTAARGTGTYDDQIIGEAEKQFQGKSTRSPAAVPATKPSKWTKVASGAGAVVLGPLAFEQATSLTAGAVNGVGSWFGWDAKGTVCGTTGSLGALGGALNWLSGQDCDQWKLDKDYLVNGDVAAGVWTATAGNLVLVKYNYPACYGFQCSNNTDPAGKYYSVTLKTNNGTNQSSAILGSNGVWYYGTIHTPEGVATGPGSSYINYFKQPGYTFCQRYGSNLTTTGTALQVCGKNPATGAPAIATPKESETDPERTLSCTVAYTDGTSLTTQGAPYRESAGDMSPPPCPATPAGKVPANVKVEDNSAAGKQTLSNQPTTPEFQDFAQNSPECGTGACLLDLLIEGADNTYVSCFDLEDGCDGWFQDAQKSDNYMCRYGAQQVDLKECTVYAGLWAPGRVAVGAPYSDPMTGAWSGGQNAPTPDRQAMAQGIQDPGGSYRSCNGMAVTGFDPIGFVMRPIQCALEWAFVPRPLVVKADFAGAGEAWDGKPPAQIAGMIGSLHLAPAAQGCSKDVTLFGVTFPIINNCPGSPMATITGISRVVTAVAMLFLVIMVLRRQIAGMVGYNQGQ